MSSSVPKGYLVSGTVLALGATTAALIVAGQAGTPQPTKLEQSTGARGVVSFDDSYFPGPNGEHLKIEMARYVVDIDPSTNKHTLRLDITITGEFTSKSYKGTGVKLGINGKSVGVSTDLSEHSVTLSAQYDLDASRPTVSVALQIGSGAGRRDLFTDETISVSDSTNFTPADYFDAAQTAALATQGMRLVSNNGISW